MRIEEICEYLNELGILNIKQLQIFYLYIQAL